MTIRQARYTSEEFARRGQEIYERVIRATLKPSDDGMFVAIDLDSDNFELDRNDYSATERLLTRCPDAQIWLMQVGQPAAYRLGVRSAPGASG